MDERELKFVLEDGMPKLTVGSVPNLTDKDPWKHRSQGMVCNTCMFFVVKENNLPEASDRPLGRCRRHAPTMGGYPAVYANDWCGDHKIDENKI
jgi:hypothetical protein